MANIIERRDRSDLIFTEVVSGVTLGTEGEQHYWRGYSAAWGLVPYAYEPAILAPTAFNKTLQDQGDRIPIVFNHRMDMPIAGNGGNHTDDVGLVGPRNTDDKGALWIRLGGGSERNAQH